jgi:amino acid transporter
MNRKRIEIFLDLGILFTGFLVLITILTEGFQFTIGDKVIGLRSFRNPLILFIIIFSIRTLRYGKPFSYLPWKLSGASGMWVLISSVAGFILIYLASMNFLVASSGQQERVMNLLHAKEFIPASSFNNSKGKIQLKSNGQYLLEFWLPAGNTKDFSKIRFSFDRDVGTQNLTSLELIYENTDGKVIKGYSRVRIVRGVFVYDFPLIDKAFDARVILIR